MEVIIRKIGNSEGVVIPKEVLERLGLKTGDLLNLTSDGGTITLNPVAADLSTQIEAARIGMEKYKVALRELAK